MKEKAEATAVTVAAVPAIWPIHFQSAFARLFAALPLFAQKPFAFLFAQSASFCHSVVVGLSARFAFLEVVAHVHPGMLKASFAILPSSILQISIKLQIKYTVHTSVKILDDAVVVGDAFTFLAFPPGVDLAGVDGTG